MEKDNSHQLQWWALKVQAGQLSPEDLLRDGGLKSSEFMCWALNSQQFLNYMEFAGGGPFQDVQCSGLLLVVDHVWMWVTIWSSVVQLLHVRDCSSHWASATHMEGESFDQLFTDIEPRVTTRDFLEAIQDNKINAFGRRMQLYFSKSKQLHVKNLYTGNTNHFASWIEWSLEYFLPPSPLDAVLILSLSVF